MMLIFDKLPYKRIDEDHWLDGAGFNVNDDSAFERKFRCQNCTARFASEDDLGEIKNIESRVSLEEPVPAGECPKCGALVVEDY